MNIDRALEIEHGLIIDGVVGIFVGTAKPTTLATPGSLYLSPLGMWQCGNLGWEKIPITLRNAMGKLHFNETTFSYWIAIL